MRLALSLPLRLRSGQAGQASRRVRASLGLGLPPTPSPYLWGRAGVGAEGRGGGGGPGWGCGGTKCSQRQVGGCFVADASGYFVNATTPRLATTTPLSPPCHPFVSATIKPPLPRGAGGIRGANCGVKMVRKRTTGLLPHGIPCLRLPELSQPASSHAAYVPLRSG